MDYTACYGGTLTGTGGYGMLISLTITNIRIDWDSYYLWCPDLPIPQNPLEQIEFFTNTQKEFAEHAEIELLGRLYNEADNPTCEDQTVLNFPVQVTRIEGGCFTWCEVVDFSPTESKPIVVKKVPCIGTKCCARTREYCMLGYYPYTPDILSSELVLLADDCQVGSGCLNIEFTSCDVGCKDLF